MTKGGEKGEAMQFHEDFRNHPYQPPAPTPDHQKQTEEDLALMTRNEYMDSFERSQEPQLPSKYAFYSSLTQEDIFKTDYTHAQRVFKHFDMRDLGDNHNFYLLTDVFTAGGRIPEFQRQVPPYLAHNYTSPGLPWQAALSPFMTEAVII